MEYKVRYAVEIYSGNTYCGNGYFDSIDSCFKFIHNDEFCDKAIILDTETHKKFTIKIEEV